MQMAGLGGGFNRCAGPDSLFGGENGTLLSNNRRSAGMEIGKLIEDRAGSQIVSASGDMPVREAIALLAAKRIGAIPVMEGDTVIGIFSERDVVYRLADEGELCLTRPLAEVMTAPPISVKPTNTVLDALALMTKRRIRHLPVIDGDAMCDFISIGDLVKARLDEIEHEAEALRTYIQTA